jgi:sporulation protein YlmC with PRC-barrel domain
MSSYPPNGTTSGQSTFGQPSANHSESRRDANGAASDTNGSLISSERVTGTSVYNHDGEKLGSVEAMMIDKQSGQVRYAVMSFGGFLGMGEKYHQLPWDGLSYDTDEGGYVVNLSREALGSAPTYSREELDNFDYGKSGSIDDYYSNIDGFRNQRR